MKYETEMAAFADCPPPRRGPAQGVAFRWVFNPMTAASFLPVAKLPKRRGKCCSDWALSMFETEAQAKTAHEAGCKIFPQFRKNGDHLAEGKLDSKCGETTVVEPDGHFDLHEYAGANLVPLFTVICPL